MSKPTVIAGPCVAESYELLEQTAQFLAEQARKLNFELIFKASFDKANRTSLASYRGPGLEQTLEWFQELKKRGVIERVTTDVHESVQVEALAGGGVDILQIPAFLCRQTDLLVAAARSGCSVSVKKGQFLAPENCVHIVDKITSASETSHSPWLIERGVSFGYGQLVVDMPSLKIMRDLNPEGKMIFDVTHATQRPAAGATTAGQRWAAPLLARAAAASGYLDGFFLEVHPDPSQAKSDSATQLSFDQAAELLRQTVPLLYQASELRAQDRLFS